MTVTGDITREPNALHGADGGDFLVAIETLEDPWTPAWEVQRIASEVAQRAEDLLGRS